MKNATRLTVLAVALLALAAVPATATEGVSPGAIDRVAVVNNACPTFSWGGNPNAAAYELVAYRLPESGQEAAELSSENEVLFASVAGAATSWTPSADQCFVGGERYVWFVRSVTELIDDQVIEAAEWSAGRYFSVPAGPSAEDVARALEVLKRWEATNGGGSPMLSSGTGTGTGTGTGHRKGVGAGEGEGHLKSVTTAEAAIRGEHPDITGEVYGVVGTSASADGAGVAAANLGGGPDLVLDGSADGVEDTVMSEAGIYKLVNGDFVFEMKNEAEGSLNLDVQGEVEANQFVVGGTPVIDNGGNWVGQGETLPCTSCVETADLEDSSVTGAKIADGAVDENALRNNAVTTGKIADGTIVQADLALSSVSKNNLQDNAVVSGKILDGTIGSADLADGAVTSAKIADGTVAGFDISANAISTVHLTDWAVETNKLDTDAVTSIKIANGAVQTSDVLNGTLKAEDVDPAGGIYASKLAVYSVPETNSIQGGSCVTIISECADANDLGLQGFCRTAPNTSMFVRYSEAVNWETESDRASWTCDFCYPDGVGTEPITGTILCISVPGP